ncbi:enoyl-CoA hydratase [Alicycliphilus denitrificans]|uniref:Enoyl-CoA hydratase/isomerase n=2 Tax=Alicycliphilus denitrificans TaxID=179636 RepID=F4GGL2_ALIDK|nr:enoyl-CoA hydratase-related protein [Alicycliphilus denitrificans]ADV01243.1 Enoyl-CoA hydratase/isomerase [Alicycliphilus denitrificans BC]AEB86237.1 Enoyl-CoA hydratase/isomerase [Alicycliphilus denitrificans K601]QKD45385.1 enoyl-CoA hydratase [Alicycliphilus denitrificans]GAO24868.1 enoyl-CoA hydratase [Alicycliphilus sp. B1]
METLLFEKDASPGVAVLTLNRPEVLNALNTAMWRELWALLRELAYDTTLACLVIQGAGPRAFSAGGDLKERNGMSDADWAAQHQLIEDVLLQIRDFPRPVIAAMHGIAHGGGIELALMCDFIIGDDTCDIALPEVKRGFLPGGGGLQNLTRAIGVRKTKQMLFSGARVHARQAHEWGVLNECVAAGMHLPRALELAREIARAAPMAIRTAKVALQQGADCDFRSGYALDLAFHNLLVRSEDRIEGIRAFNEKREPKWTQR